MCRIGRQTDGMHNELSDSILQIVERLPQWIRQDMSSKEEQIKLRADEALSAILASHLGSQWNNGDPDEAKAETPAFD